jgi:SepF-like predicted cell division protein (DUF552 family)
MIKKIKEILDSDKSINIIREDFCKKNYNDFYVYISSSFGDTHQQRLYSLLNDIKEIPKCNICNEKELRFINSEKGYSNYCSTKCTSNSPEVKKKRIDTNIKKYGTENPAQSNDIKQKIKDTFLENYGVDNPNKTKEVRDKIKATNQERYGSNTVLTDISKNNRSDLDWKSIREKSKQTIFNEIGLYTKTGTREWKEKVSKTVKEKYGEEIEHYSQSKTVKQKKLNNQLERIKSRYNNNNYEFISYDNSETELTLKHLVCNKQFSEQIIFIQQRYNLDIELCVHCKTPGHILISKGHNELIEYIKSIYNGNIIINDRRQISKTELDIYLPDLKIALEFNGLYYHNELKKTKTYHQDKTLLCNKNGIRLIHIWEDDWNNKKTILKSIIKSKLGYLSNKIYARQCIIKEIKKDDEKLFLNHNHLQGYNQQSFLSLGLYYNDELVSLINFSKKRISLGNSSLNEIELLRYANKLEYNIVGGFSKLLSYFKKNYVFNELVTYGDLSFVDIDNNVYSKNGFKFIKVTEPDYFYIVNSIRQHRFNYRKDILVKQGFDKNKTEKQIMLDRKLYRIYGCGNLKYKFIND